MHTKPLGVMKNHLEQNSIDSKLPVVTDLTICPRGEGAWSFREVTASIASTIDPVWSSCFMTKSSPAAEIAYLHN